MPSSSVCGRISKAPLIHLNNAIVAGEPSAGITLECAHPTRLVNSQWNSAPKPAMANSISA